MIRRTAVVAMSAAAVCLTAPGLNPPAVAADVTATSVTSPVDGTHYLITDQEGSEVVLVEGTSTGTTTDYVDLRCYFKADYYWTLVPSIQVNADGTWAANVNSDSFYGTCVLRAVPHDWPGGNSLVAYPGIKVTTEWDVSTPASGGPNDGKVFDYYVLVQGASAMNDFQSISGGGLYDSRLQSADGLSSNYLWFSAATLLDDDLSKSALQVDGKNAYPPSRARVRRPDNPGLPEVSHSVSRNLATGVVTIREVDPIVVCPANDFPPTAGSCPQFVSAGVRVERTMVIDDGGRQVHVSDVWRSTDGKAHIVSPHYTEWVDNTNSTTLSGTTTPVSLKLPWIDGVFHTFVSAGTYAAPQRVPATAYIRTNNDAPDGDVSPRGALSFDLAPSQLFRSDEGRRLVLRDDGLVVPAGGTRLVRQDLVIGSSDAEVAAKAATNQARINPYRADGAIRKSSATTYAGNNTYNTTAVGQTVTATKKRKKTVTFVVRVQNDGTAPDSFKILGRLPRKGFAVKYLAGASGTTDISTAVKNGTYTLTNLAPGATRTFRLVIKVKSTAKLGILRSWLVTTTSTHDTSRKDAVQASVRVAKH